MSISQYIEDLTTKLAKKCVDFLNYSEYRHLNYKIKKIVLNSNNKHKRLYNVCVYIYEIYQFI